jgi:hypothetical protein
MVAVIESVMASQLCNPGRGLGGRIDCETDVLEREGVQAPCAPLAVPRLAATPRASVSPSPDEAIEDFQRARSITPTDGPSP